MTLGRKAVQRLRKKNQNPSGIVITYNMTFVGNNRISLRLAVLVCRVPQIDFTDVRGIVDAFQ